MKSILEANGNLANVKKKTLIQRIAIIATTLIVVICCVVVIVKKQQNRNIERQQQEAINQVEHEARLQREREEAAQRAEEQRLRELQYQRQRDSIATTLPKVETPEPPKPTWSWNDIENMVRNLTNEDYYASIWIEEYDTPRWVVIYCKGGKTYFRHFNADKKTYGTKVRLIRDDTGKYHASGNKRDRYDYQGNQLVHIVNGVEKERFSNHKIIDLFTPEPVPDGYDDWEDYYYDNEEDLHYYYGH